MKTKNKTIVGLDLSITSTGVAVYDSEKRTKLFMVLTKADSFPTAEQRVRNIAFEVRDKIYGELKERGLKPADVFWGVEDYAFSNRAGRLASLAEVSSLVKQVLWADTGRLPIKINPKTLKKFLTGRGDVAKNLHLLYAFTKWGIKFPNDDVCDAYAVARLVHAVLFGEVGDLFAYEVECCKAVKSYNEGCPTLKEGKNDK